MLVGAAVVVVLCEVCLLVDIVEVEADTADVLVDIVEVVVGTVGNVEVLVVTVEVEAGEVDKVDVAVEAVDVVVANVVVLASKSRPGVDLVGCEEPVLVVAVVE